MKELENLFSSSTRIVPLSVSWPKAIIIRLLDRNEPISPVGNIVTKVRMGVGDGAVNVICFPKCYYRSR